MFPLCVPNLFYSIKLSDLVDNGFFTTETLHLQHPLFCRKFQFSLWLCLDCYSPWLRFNKIFVTLKTNNCFLTLSKVLLFPKPNYTQTWKIIHKMIIFSTKKQCLQCSCIAKSVLGDTADWTELIADYWKQKDRCLSNFTLFLAEAAIWLLLFLVELQSHLTL